jgi:hypothetical protein
MPAATRRIGRVAYAGIRRKIARKQISSIVT